MITYGEYLYFLGQHGSSSWYMSPSTWEQSIFWQCAQVCILESYLNTLTWVELYFLTVSYLHLLWVSTAAATFRQAVALIFDSVACIESLPPGKIGSGSHTSRASTIMDDISRSFNNSVYVILSLACFSYLWFLLQW